MAEITLRMIYTQTLILSFFMVHQPNKHVDSTCFDFTGEAKNLIKSMK